METITDYDKKVKFFFIILLFKNTTDIRACIKSIKQFKIDCQILLVNSYYDDPTLHKVKEIALEEKCEFLNIPNKGYGYGNNRGIEFANQNYDYDFIIISNPDIIIKKFKEPNFSREKKVVIGPIIKTKNGKMQNPYLSIDCIFLDKLLYSGFKSGNKIKTLICYAINRLIREGFLFGFRFKEQSIQKVYAVHGSFFLISHKALDEIGLPYDEDMFLFAEESHLAHLLKEKRIPAYIDKNIEILHKEDGSINLSDINIVGEAARSYIIYYEKMKQRTK